MWAFHGLDDKFHRSIDPEKFLPNRSEMLQRADQEAHDQLERHKHYEIQKAPMGIRSEDEDDEDEDMLQDKDDASYNRG